MTKILLKKIIVASFISFAIFFNFSCKSSTEIEKIEPLELLEPNSTVYFSIPVKSNFEFSKKIVTSLIASEKSAEKDAEDILKRLDVIYISFNMKTSEFSMSASGDFPVTMSKFVLTEKKGWAKNNFNSHKYYSNKSGMNLSFITSDIACVSSKSAVLENQLSRYDKILANEDIERVSFETYENDISFFFPNAKDAMALLAGGFSLGGIQSVSGKLLQIPNKEEFSMEFDLKLSDVRMKKAITGLMSMAFMLSNAEIVQSEKDDIISVKGFVLPWTFFVQTESIE